MERSLQDRFLPEGRCFGCGPANSLGLQLKSFATDERTLEANVDARGASRDISRRTERGIIGTLLDCHSNWTAWWSLFSAMETKKRFPLTAEYAIKLLRPTLWIALSG